MVHIDGVATELTRRGHEVNVIIQKSSNSINISEKKYELTLLLGDTYSITGQIKFMYELYKYLKGKSYSIIHTKNPFSSILPTLILKKMNVIYDSRGLWIEFGIRSGYIPTWVSSILYFIENRCLKKADRIIVISNELKKYFIKKGLNKEKIFVIQGAGVNLNKINKLQKIDLKRMYNIEGVILGYVGSIGRSRFSDKIIDSMVLLRELYDNKFKLFMIGPFGKNEEEYFKEYVKDKILDDYIIFTGLLPHSVAIQYIKSFDVALAYHESDDPIFNVAVPTKILEYLAAGTTIIATDQKMYKNIIKHNYDGFLTSQNPMSFAEGILHVLNNKALMQYYASNGINTVKKYDIKTITNLYEKIYLLMNPESREFNNGDKI